jgi:hypothetical protein
MSFDLRIVCVGPSEPMLWIAIGIAAVVAAFLGRRLGRRLARVSDPIRRWLYGGLLSCGLFGGAVILGVSLLQVLFSTVTGGAMLCPAFVGPYLVVPGGVALTAEWTGWVRERATPAASAK